MLATHRHKLIFYPAIKQVIGRLVGDKADKVAQLADQPGLDELPCRMCVVPI